VGSKLTLLSRTGDFYLLPQPFRAESHTATACCAVESVSLSASSEDCATWWSWSFLRPRRADCGRARPVSRAESRVGNDRVAGSVCGLCHSRRALFLLFLFVIRLNSEQARCTNIWLRLFHFSLPPARQRPRLLFIAPHANTLIYVCSIL
jgi:hypothetical protein